MPLPAQRRNKRIRNVGCIMACQKKLQITLLMMRMEDAPATRKQNNDDLNWSRGWRAKKDKVSKEKVLEDAEDEFV